VQHLGRPRQTIAQATPYLCFPGTTHPIPSASGLHASWHGCTTWDERIDILYSWELQFFYFQAPLHADEMAEREGTQVNVVEKTITQPFKESKLITTSAESRDLRDNVESQLYAFWRPETECTLV
jgi:hypothetical protein